MNYKIKYMDSAIEGIKIIKEFLGRRSSTAPSIVSKKIIAQIKKLASSPNISRVSELDSRFRQMPIDKNVVLYLVDEESKTVEIHYIWDGRRNLERLLKEEKGEKIPALELDLDDDYDR